MLRVLFSRCSRVNGLIQGLRPTSVPSVFFSILSVRLDFYPLVDVSFLKQPIIYSLSKLLQFVAIVCGFLWLANALTKEKRLLIYAMNAYWVTGIACSAYAILCYLFLLVTHSSSLQDSIFGAYLASGVRARAFFNEGGPYGTYMVSVFVVGLLRRHVAGRPLGKINTAILVSAFIMSASKAGFFAAACLLLYSAISHASFIRKISYLILTIGLLWGLAVSLNFGNQLYGYLYSFENLQQQVAARGTDLNLVAGRVSALYIVPKMISAHPITGIGYGNYPLMRNDPHYLGILPPIPTVEDIPGIGIPGIAAELGIPATLWLLLLLLWPYWRNRKQAAILSVAALFQILAHAFAVQLTFFYPWFVSACAVAASLHEPEFHRRVRATSMGAS